VNSAKAPTALPYDDLDVIDARAPRANQAVVGTIALIAVLTGWWGLVALLALQLAVGLRFGRRYCLPCVFYFEVIQPRFGEGEIEDSRPPRFANQVGVAFLGASTVAYALGGDVVGTVLASMVAALALLAAATGLCVGCELYKLGARFRGIRPGHFDRIDVADLGSAPGDGTVVHFTHPLCTGCREVEESLLAEGRRLVLVDVSQRRDLARKYGVAVVPTAVAVAADGRVLERIA
jgi:Domain of unknown function (DUF4395)